jgi:hypothetical protein
MKVIPFQNANGSVITVTSTSTLLANLVNTAQSTNLFPLPWNNTGADGINITPEDGDVRYLADGNTPTATKGQLLKEGQTYFLRQVDLTNFRLIRVGGANVACSIAVGVSDAEESSAVGGSAGGGGGGGDVNITEIGGTAVSVDSGDADAGTIRTVNADRAGTATLSNVASSATNVTVLAANASRKAAALYNDSTSAVNVKFGATASSTSYTVRMLAGAYYELPVSNGVVYQGIIDGIWDSANGSMRVTELT